ncbi:glycosyltransferase [Dyadobacter sp. CY356]|uniref:glycosyltransferase family 4 protein n=1 Tax=Dyadobacter sp. CY356 TaxID=2906442 RepID=UPI001F2305FE|nr:glycosyltransferase [Dyadobacter sp. CY356]MCF0055162.1 glycosyltransferase [Dyadobacter sp. CY356]
MKVLWFCDSPGLYKKQNSGYNGCGWISSLIEAISVRDDIELAICLLHPDNVFKDKLGHVTYYPISLYNTYLKKLKHNLFYDKYDGIETNAYKQVVDDFKPDVIHIFGSEQGFGLIHKVTDIPIVIHIQGILGPYLNAFFPANTNLNDYNKYSTFAGRLKKNKDLRFFTHNARREEEILSNNVHFMGRTDWDENIIKLYSPKANYYYCSEILRSEFYNARPWCLVSKEIEVIKIITTISKVDYKGFDLILKTAKLLQKFTNKKFEWNVFGISEFPFWEQKLKIISKETNVNLRGIATADELIISMQEADMYIHPSYIDNSPNSLCEAQLIGMPVISTNVGGIPSLIEEGKTGLMISSNDPYSLTSKILYIKDHPNIAINLGKRARDKASERHNINSIILQNIAVYKSIGESA